MKWKPRIYTDEILISKLKQYYEEFNRVPSRYDIMKNPDYPSPVTFINYFGSWKNALAKANLIPLKNYTYTEDELISILQSFDEKPSKRMMGGDLPAAETYVYRFGSWTNALEKAGY